MAPDRNVETLANFIKFAKAKSDAVSHASIGVGNPAHFYGERIAKSAGTRMTLVPCKGESAMLPDLFSGRVDSAFFSAVAAYQYNDPRKLRLVGCTGKKRSAGRRSTPTASGSPRMEWTRLAARRPSSRASCA